MMSARAGHDTLCQGLAPEVSADIRVLVLGSMPGQVSLQERRYYAHPRNAFWPLMERLLGIRAGLPYARRLSALQQAGIGLWDVYAECERAGSLDADITAAVANDFNSFLRQRPGIVQLLFNGAKAEQGFRRQVLPGLQVPCPLLSRLPSTSPAHAAMSFEDKVAPWGEALRRAGITLAG